MIKNITITPETNTSKILFFKKADLEPFANHVIPLFGPNGAGKSTLLKELEKAAQLLTIKDPEKLEYYQNDKNFKSDIKITADDDPIKVLSYYNSTDNFKNRKPKSVNESFNPYYISARFDAMSISEGQSIVYSVFDLLDALKPGKDSFCKDDCCNIILLDEIDSGLSIDNIDTVMRKIQYATRKRNNMQIFLSFNSPRVLKFFPQVLSMYDGNIHEIHNEDDMMNLINLHKEMFNKARKKSNGRPKIFN